MVAVEQSRVRSASEQLADDARLYAVGESNHIHFDQIRVSSQHRQHENTQHLFQYSKRTSLTLYSMSTFKADAAFKAIYTARGSNVDVEFKQSVKKRVLHMRRAVQVFPLTEEKPH